MFQYKDSTYGLIYFFFFCNSIARGQQSPVHDSENYAVVASNIFVYIGALYL